jgi:hypothetical protein
MATAESQAYYAFSSIGNNGMRGVAGGVNFSRKRFYSSSWSSNSNNFNGGYNGGNGFSGGYNNNNNGGYKPSFAHSSSSNSSPSPSSSSSAAAAPQLGIFSANNNNPMNYSSMHQQQIQPTNHQVPVSANNNSYNGSRRSSYVEGFANGKGESGESVLSSSSKTPRTSYGQDSSNTIVLSSISDETTRFIISSALESTKNPFTPEQLSVIERPVLEESVEVKYDGSVYLPANEYRKILDEAFGAGGNQS